MVPLARSKTGAKLPTPNTLKKLIRQGYGRNQIATRYDVSPARVRDRLTELGLKAPTNGMPGPMPMVSIIFLETREGLVSLPRVSMIASMEKYA
ncbi:hypothetical protein ASF91_17090 [Rhizobium sp. Leaf155]|nr:hypothetical protein ASF91_17090 [Rhizobium sp. Leaf155]